MVRLARTNACRRLVDHVRALCVHPTRTRHRSPPLASSRLLILGSHGYWPAWAYTAGKNWVFEVKKIVSVSTVGQCGVFHVHLPTLLYTGMPLVVAVVS